MQIDLLSDNKVFLSRSLSTASTTMSAVRVRTPLLLFVATFALLVAVLSDGGHAALVKRTLVLSTMPLKVDCIHNSTYAVGAYTPHGVKAVVAKCLAFC